jgi:hypothetical protein
MLFTINNFIWRIIMPAGDESKSNVNYGSTTSSQPAIQLEAPQAPNAVIAAPAPQQNAFVKVCCCIWTAAVPVVTAFERIGGALAAAEANAAIKNLKLPADQEAALISSSDAGIATFASGVAAATTATVADHTTAGLKAALATLAASSTQSLAQAAQGGTAVLGAQAQSAINGALAQHLSDNTNLSPMDQKAITAQLNTIVGSLSSTIELGAGNITQHPTVEALKNLATSLATTAQSSAQSAAAVALQVGSDSANQAVVAKFSSSPNDIVAAAELRAAQTAISSAAGSVAVALGAVEPSVHSQTAPMAVDIAGAPSQVSADALHTNAAHTEMQG